MTIKTCPRHGAWDDSVWESCPECARENVKLLKDLGEMDIGECLGGRLG